jgi:hypothetical protein
VGNELLDHDVGYTIGLPWVPAEREREHEHEH